MDARSVTLCLLHTALKWPERLDSVTACIATPPLPDPVYGALWRAIKQVRAAEGRTLDPETFRDNVQFAVEALSPSYASNCRSLIRHVAASASPTFGHCMDLLKRHAGLQLFESTDWEDPMAHAIIEEKLGRIRAIGGDGPTPDRIDLFANDGTHLLYSEPVIQTGLWLVDGGFGGLWPSGTLVLWVMPTKSGKSLLSLQLARHLIEKKHAVMYMNFEQAAKGNLAQRIYVLASESTISEWQNVGSFSRLAEPVRARLNENMADWSNYFYGYAAESFDDPDVLNKGAESLAAMIRRVFVERNQQMPALVILDWWRDLWERFQASMTIAGKIGPRTDLRQLELQQFKLIKLMGQMLNIRLMVLMQMRQAMLNTPAALNIDKVSAQDAAENKGLAQYADAVVVSTKKDKNGIVSFKIDLSRFTDNTWRTSAVMDGQHQLFLPTSGTGAEPSEDSLDIDAADEAAGIEV